MTFNRRALIKGALAAPLFLGSASAAAKQAFSGKGDWTQWFHDWMLKDFGMIGYYADDNAKLLASHAPVDVVFLGDSITEGWFDKHPSYFVNGRVDRGIGGQTSSQMVLRMMSDVVDLKPKVVHIMAGTNDVAGNTGAATLAFVQGNIESMAELARLHGIKVILASIPPAAAFPWSPAMRPAEPIIAFNAWLRAYAARNGFTYLDYHAALADAQGGMKPGLATDGVHPTPEGYAIMRPLALAAIARTLGHGR